MKKTQKINVDKFILAWTLLAIMTMFVACETMTIQPATTASNPTPAPVEVQVLRPGIETKIDGVVAELGTVSKLLGVVLPPQFQIPALLGLNVITGAWGGYKRRKSQLLVNGAKVIRDAVEEMAGNGTIHGSDVKKIISRHATLASGPMTMPDAV